jgi:hypothetical protein
LYARRGGRSDRAILGPRSVTVIATERVLAEREVNRAVLA